jgi:hypothetical protein
VTPTADLVGYRHIPLWLNQDELAELINEIRSIIVSKIDDKPAPDRSLHLLSPIPFPIEEPTQNTSDNSRVGSATSSQLCPTACPTSLESPMAKPKLDGIIIRVSGVRVPPPAWVTKPRLGGVSPWWSTTQRSCPRAIGLAETDAAARLTIGRAHGRTGVACRT